MRPTHPAFLNAGRQKGIEIWRIENFEPVRYPAKDYGKFYTGDSYIILQTNENKNKDLSWDVHFWLGSETSTDEAGAAAILTVQLDDLLNGDPVQHREVQDHESQMFLGYFKNGIRYEKGGVASGFQHAEVNAAGEKRLFQVKGKRNVRVRQVNLSISSMNRGDCFILDAGNNIYVYVGSSAKRVEKLKAISAANQIRDQDHHGRARVHIIDDFSTPMDKEEFFTVLGSGSPDQVPAASVAEEDAEFEKKDERGVTLYKISDASGSLKVDTISQKPLRQDMLDTRDCFILDTGSGLYVWVGKGATQQEKTQSMAKAQEFLKMKKYPAWTNIERVVEGAESAPFKQYFSTWRDYGMSHTRLIRAANDDDSDTAEDVEFDPAVLHALKKSGGRAIGFMPDNGDGELEAVYRIENFALAEIPKEMYGMLFGGDSYVIKYHYMNKRGGQGYVLYYWQGKESSIDEKAAAALHAYKLDDELNGTAVQVRVTQGFEPRHFLKVFQGKLITFIGGHASGFKNVDDPETYESGVRLFRVRGTCQEDVRADQRPAIASSLASDDAFILEVADKVYVWKGRGASDFEKEMAANVVQRIASSKELVEISEESEPSDFWDALGGEGDYDKVLDPAYPPFLEPRLFHCKILANGRFKVEEVHHFEQEDLDVDDIMVLDGGDEIYVWIGDGSTKEEKEKSIDMAKQYIRTDPSERSEETVPLVKIQQGNEPRSFKRLFPAWDDDVWTSIPTYESLKESVREANSQLDNEV
ncbi:gelsolin isoform X3 [Hermetia illucens]|nr:gelsolin isoform X3 [Hermetia illucens]